MKRTDEHERKLKIKEHSMRADEMDRFIKEPAWHFLKKYCQRQIDFYSNIARINENDLNNSYLKAKIHVDIYNSFIKLPDVWIKEGERLKKNIKKGEQK